MWYNSLQSPICCFIHVRQYNFIKNRSLDSEVIIIIAIIIAIILVTIIIIMQLLHIIKY